MKRNAFMMMCSMCMCGMRSLYRADFQRSLSE